MTFTPYGPRFSSVSFVSEGRRDGASILEEGGDPTPSVILFGLDEGAVER